MTVNRRQALGLMASLGLVAQFGPARAATRFEPPKALLDAAGKLDAGVIDHSDLGRAMSIRDQGNMTALKNPPLPPDMFDVKVNKLWIPDDGSLMPLHDKWLEEWNRIYGYRQ